MRPLIAAALLSLAGCASSPAVEPADDTQTVTGVDGPVEVVVDRYGWPHVFASTLKDAAFGEGYAMARDRMAQLELFRRTASGRLAEVFGGLSGKFMESDVTMRTIGLRGMAETIWAQTPEGRTHDMFAGYAAGVNLYLSQLRSGQARAPRGSELLLTPAIEDWTPVDSFTVLRLMELNLSFNADEEINRTVLRDRARAVFEQADPVAHPELAARKGFISDAWQFRPPSGAMTVPDFYASAKSPGARRPTRSIARAALGKASAALSSLRRVLPESHRLAVGTNAWAISGAHTASGHALLANDPHLPLLSPSVLWGVQFTVTKGSDALDVTGTAFPGVPGVVFGHNPRVAWGITNAMFDQMDVYEETLTAGSALFQGQQVPLQTRIEHIPNGVLGTLDVQIETVPHHGPILPVFASEGVPAKRTSSRALSVRWVAAEPSHEVDGLIALMFSTDCHSAQEAVRAIEVPSMGFVLADRNGDIAFRATGKVPIRAPGAHTFDPVQNPDGTLPAAVLPGTGEAEWVGYVDAAHLPALGTQPFIASANNDLAGLSRDGNPFDEPVYLGYAWSEGFRTERIGQRLQALGDRATRKDMEAIQADHVMLVAQRFTPFFLDAVEHLESEWGQPGSHEGLTAVASTLRPRAAVLRDLKARLEGWSFDTPTDSVAASVFHAWLSRVQDLALSDELEALQDPTPGAVAPVMDPERRMLVVLAMLEHPYDLRARDATTHESALWDDLRTPAVKETRDAILLAALAAAVDDLTTLTGSAEPSAWQWGAIHTLRFSSVLPNFTLSLFADLSIPPGGEPAFARPGGIDTLDQGWPVLADEAGKPAPVFSYGQGPARRLTIEMAPDGPIAFDALPGGESGDLTSPHFADEAELWRTNRSHPLFQTHADVVANSDQRTRLLPAR